MIEPTKESFEEATIHVYKNSYDEWEYAVYKDQSPEEAAEEDDCYDGGICTSYSIKDVLKMAIDNIT